MAGGAHGDSFRPHGSLCWASASGDEAVCGGEEEHTVPGGSAASPVSLAVVAPPSAAVAHTGPKGSKKGPCGGTGSCSVVGHTAAEAPGASAMPLGVGYTLASTALVTAVSKGEVALTGGEEAGSWEGAAMCCCGDGY